MKMRKDSKVKKEYRKWIMVILAATAVSVVAAGCRKNTETLAGETNVTGDGQSTGALSWAASVIGDELGDDDQWVLVDIGEEEDVLLVSDSTYQDGDGNNASVFCEVWFGIDGNACDLGRIESMSTAYPIRYGDQCLYTASNQSFEIWMIDNENCELALKTQYQVVYGEDGSEAYYRIEDGVETVISEEEFWASYEIYESGTVARFAYGASDRS